MPLIAHALHDALQRHHPETALHSRRVAALLARVQGDVPYALFLAAACHDAGKLHLPRALLDKRGPLSDEEWLRMQMHPEKGMIVYCGLAQQYGLRLVPEVLDVVYAHHERWDGAGYPRGLLGAQIPRLARLVAVLDAYDAMTHQRSYAPALAHGAALEELWRGAGTQFDPVVVAAVAQAL